VSARPAYQFQPQERAAAKEAGLSTYFTGRPCKHGHTTLRITANGTCVECAKKLQKSCTLKRLEKDPLYYRKRYARNAETQLAKAAEYRAKNPEKVKTSNKAWREKNKHKKAAMEMRRQASKIQATPKWLSKEDLVWIESYYKDANYFNRIFDSSVSVDHIVPLRSKVVCGLHVPWNLCLRTKVDNSRKNNKLTDDVYWPKQSGVLVAQSALPWNLRKEAQNGNFL
jgi:hypothetical protein